MMSAADIRDVLGYFLCVARNSRLERMSGETS